MISPDNALAIVLDNVSLLPGKPVRLTESLNCLLMEDVVAPWDCPSFDRAMMDGFAVKMTDQAKGFKRIGRLQAGEVWAGPFPEGSCIEIMTGAPCPEGTDMVVPYEESRQEGERVFFPEPRIRGEFIALRGSECRKGQVLLKKGERITPLVISVLASFGQTEAIVHPVPRISVIVTGREILSTGQPGRSGLINDANGPMLEAMARELGVHEIRVAYADDTLEDLTSVISCHLESDIVLLTGGVSEGLFDLVPQTLESLGVEILFHKVSQKPGKPLLFGKKKNQLFFGLPGNPLSVYLGFHRYVAPALRIMQGKAPQPKVEQGRGRIEADGGDRTRFLLARAEKEQDSWALSVFNHHRSSDIFSVCSANCMIRVQPADNIPDNRCENIQWAFQWLGKKGWEE